MKICRTCRYWQPERDKPSAKGQCRRRAPTSTIINDWPVTRPDGWCGEYEAAPRGGV